MSLMEMVDGSIELPPTINGFHPETRCRVCRDDEVRKKVNDLLATGANYAMVLRAPEDANAARDTGDRVTVDSVRNHASRHFPVQNVAKATYREILERRAEENGIDFVQGVATAITPMAFLETLVVKGYETLVDSDTKVDVKSAMVAACRLQELIDARAGEADWAKATVQIGRIIETVWAFIPEEQLPQAGHAEG